MITTKDRDKPTSAKMKLYADLLLTFSMGATGIVMGLPITDNTKLWLVAGIGFIGMGGKLLTNVVDFKVREEEKEIPYSHESESHIS